MHHPDRLACLHERPRIYKLRCNGYTCTGCYLNFSPSNRIILREILIGIDRRKVARSPRKSYRCDSMLFSSKIKKREKDATTFPSSFSPCGISIRPVRATSHELCKNLLVIVHGVKLIINTITVSPRNILHIFSFFFFFSLVLSCENSFAKISRNIQAISYWKMQLCVIFDKKKEKKYCNSCTWNMLVSLIP